MTDEKIGSSVSVAMNGRLGYVLVSHPLATAELDTMEYAAILSRQNVNIDWLNTPHSLITVIGEKHFTPEERTEHLQGVAYTIATTLSILRGGTIELNAAPVLLDDSSYSDLRTIAL